MNRFSISLLFFYISIVLAFSCISASLNYQAVKVAMERLVADKCLSDQDYAFIIENPTIDFAYIPQDLKISVRNLQAKYPQLDSLIDISLFVNEATHVIPYETMKKITQQLYEFLISSDIKNHDPENTTLEIVHEYMDDPQSGVVGISLEQLEQDNAIAVRSKRFKIYCNLLVRNCLRAGALNVCGNALIGGNLTVNGTINGNIGNLGTVDHAVQVGNAAGTLTSLGVGTDGQVLLGSTGLDPAFANLTSIGGTIVFTTGPNSLNLEATGATTSSYPTDAGTATPLGGVLNIFGGSNINTSGAGSTVTINLDNSPSVSGSLTAGTTVTAGTGLNVTSGGINSTGTTTLNSLGAGVMNTNGLGVVSSTATVDHAVQVGNAAGTLTSLGVGTDGQVLLGSTGLDPVFSTLMSTNGSVQFTPGAGTLNLAAIPVFGNVVRVDSVFGNDATGARNGPPFLTINAALAVALPGDVVWIFPGTYDESFTIPSGVSVVGLSQTPGGGVNISRNVAVATDLVTMSTNTRLDNVTLTLTSAAHVQLRGIVFPGTTTLTARAHRITMSVDNSTAGAGTSDVYGIYSNGTGLPNDEVSNLRASLIVVASTGLGSKRGILVDTANAFHARDNKILVTNTGAGSAIGLETNNAGALLTIRTSTISGTTADISQTLGMITCVTTDLLNSNANGLGFTTTITPSIIVWGDSGMLPAGTNFMKVGTAAPNGNEQFVRAPQGLIIKTLSVRMRLTPGTTDTFTLRKNGVDTALTVSLTNPALTNTNNAVSVTFADGDSISVKVVRGAAGGTEAVIGMELY